MVERALKAEVLVIDDLGQEQPDTQSAVGEIISARFERSDTTIITCALSPEELGVRYGGGIQRRLFEGAHHVKVSSGGKR